MVEAKGDVSFWDLVLREGNLSNDEGHYYTDVLAAYLKKNPNLTEERLSGVTGHLQSCQHCNRSTERLRDYYSRTEPDSEVRSIPELQRLEAS